VLTYQIRPRVLLVESGKLTFPNHAEIELRFDPSPAFGGDAPPGQTVRLGSTARAQWDANRGRSATLGLPPMDPLNVHISDDGMSVHMQGPLVRVDFECPERATLLGVLGALRYLLPLILNLEFADPPVAVMSSGRVGEVEFNWQVERTAASFEAVDQQNHEAKVSRAWQRLALVSDGGNVRLRTAGYYFYKACRLEQAGSAASEFLAEILLNLAKTLEVLFPVTDQLGSRDTVRAELRALGYTDEEVESNFLPAMALRDEIDVAHVSLASFDSQQLGTIFRYAEGALHQFRLLLRRVFDAVTAGSLTLEPYEDTGPRKQATVLLNRLSERYGPAQPQG
jgi:hypothetical protein